MKNDRTIAIAAAAVLAAAYPLAAQLSIYQIQYTTDPAGSSSYHGSIVDCRGGIVLYKSSGSRTRLVLYDPDYPDGWSGIMAKDLDGAGVFAGINVGDRVSFSNVEVEDFRGTTFLQFTNANNAAYTVISSGNVLPRPLIVGADEIAAPAQGPASWLVADRTAEKYESMFIKVVDVRVTDAGYGKAYDNYVLQSNADPDHTCWASDYLNDDNTQIYHPYVKPGSDFCGVSGLLEQYAGNSDGIEYDYYQLLTTGTGDFTIEQQADIDGDCVVDFFDYASFSRHWLDDSCDAADGCGGADMFQDASNMVDELDLMELAMHWLEGRY